MRLATTLFAATSALAPAVRAVSPAARPLDVYWVDVEGGGATLLVTPAGESVLIDAGNPGGRDAGRIHEAATRAGLRRIDHLVVTHLHRDHFGGVAELAERIPIGTLYENGIDAAPETERAQPDVEAYRKAKAGRRVVIEPGSRIELKQASGAAPLQLRALAARQRFDDSGAARANTEACRAVAEKEADATDNANSVVLLLELGGFRFFDGGDLTWNLEARLVCPQDRVGPVDVYQSDHHGLDRSNNPVLLRTLQPRVVVFNNGPRKGYEPESAAAAHATPSVAAVYQLHRNVREGAANSDATRIANHAEACSGQHVHMSVDASGRGYTLTVPATGHRQRFETRRGSKDAS